MGDVTSIQASKTPDGKWGFSVFKSGITLSGRAMFRDISIMLGLVDLRELRGAETIRAITSHLDSQGYQPLIDYTVTQN